MQRITRWEAQNPSKINLDKIRSVRSTGPKFLGHASRALRMNDVYARAHAYPLNLQEARAPAALCDGLTSGSKMA